jgi:hypothetical protein
MPNYKHYLTSTFSGCRLLANAHDHCRNREVKIYEIPNEPSIVGIFDGCDRWIAPARAELFSVNIEKVQRSIREGTFTGAVTTATLRRRPVTADAAVPAQIILRRR